MAKLKARGRTEIFRVVRERDNLPRRDTDPVSNWVVWRRDTVTLMSDGNFLRKKDARWKDGSKHTWDWTVDGKIKAGLTVEGALEIYAKAGYEVEHAYGVSGFDKAYFAALAATKASGGPAPERPASLGNGRVMRTEAKAEREKAAKVKRATAREHELKTKHGAGYYVVNSHTGNTMFKPYAAELGPYEKLETAIDKAEDRYVDFMRSRFTYLLPVMVVEASSRTDAEYGKHAHVYWKNGKNMGMPVHPSQTSLF